MILTPITAKSDQYTDQYWDNYTQGVVAVDGQAYWKATTDDGSCQGFGMTPESAIMYLVAAMETKLADLNKEK